MGNIAGRLDNFQLQNNFKEAKNLKIKVQNRL